ncbi:15362_t:CDS:2, partial [Funneliformis caledonium]
GETVSKLTLNQKIYLRVLIAKGDIELLHSEFAYKAIPVKIIKDRSKCLRTNKCILDTYLLRNLSEEAVEIPLVMEYNQPENAISKVKYLSCDNDNSIAKILLSRAITTKPKHHKISYIKKTYFMPKESIFSEIKALYSRE